MDAQTLDARPTRRRAARTPKPQDASKAKLSLHFPAELARRLAIHAAAEGRSQSELAASLLDPLLRRYVLSDRAKAPASEHCTVSA